MYFGVNPVRANMSFCVVRWVVPDPHNRATVSPSPAGTALTRRVTVVGTAFHVR